MPQHALAHQARQVCLYDQQQEDVSVRSARRTALRAAGWRCCSPHFRHGGLLVSPITILDPATARAPGAATEGSARQRREMASLLAEAPSGGPDQPLCLLPTVSDLDEQLTAVRPGAR